MIDATRRARVGMAGGGCYRDGRFPWDDGPLVSFGFEGSPVTFGDLDMYGVNSVFLMAVRGCVSASMQQGLRRIPVELLDPRHSPAARITNYVGGASYAFPQAPLPSEVDQAVWLSPWDDMSSEITHCDGRSMLRGGRLGFLARRVV